MATIIKKIDFDPEFEPLAFDSETPSPVIKHQILGGIEKGSEIILRARKEASRLRKRAKEVLAQAVVEKEEERKRGLDDGFQEGLSQVTGRLLELANAREKILKEAEPTVIRMVLEIAEKVIGRELERGAVVEIVKNAIAQAAGQRVVVRLNPSDVAVVKERERELLVSIDQTRSITVKEDDTIPAGGCIVETELGTVDARLETQLKAIRKALGL